MRNELKRKRVRRNESGIINLDTSSGPGTHWVAYKKRGNVAIYFDPFGLQPPTEVIKYLRPSKIYYSANQVQRLGTKNCGKLCLKFLFK